METYDGHVNEEVLKQSPHVTAAVDLLHLNLCVDVAVVQEVDVGGFHLKLNFVENCWVSRKSACKNL